MKLVVIEKQELMESISQAFTPDLLVGIVEGMGYVHADKMLTKEEAATMLGIGHMKSWERMMNHYTDPKRYDKPLRYYRFPDSREKIYRASFVIEFREQFLVDRAYSRKL